MNYDDCATKTGDGDAQPYEDVACSFLFKTSAGNILFLGDTWYNDAYVAIGQKYDIDVAVFDIGYNAPGAFDKMTPYDGARLGKALKAKVLIPDHWENWANSSSDPDMLVRQFESISADICPECKTVIMRCAGRFDYPKDQAVQISRSERQVPSGSFHVCEISVTDLRVFEKDTLFRVSALCADAAWTLIGK